jgi:geranylgeranyl pyrophosphate synthase
MITVSKNSEEQKLQKQQERINSFLQNILPSPNLAPQHLHQAMHYAVLNGGKRIRPLLVYATGEALGVDLELLDIPAAAVELIHAYSLVHDDLPAMDNDDLRRGLPTCHKAFDEATAILTGDALQALAFNLLSQNHRTALSSQIRIDIVHCLTQAASSLGMAGGQALDLKATHQQLKLEDLNQIHQLKTGAMISACIQVALLIAQIQEPTTIRLLTHFAHNIGLCFQIQDDILNAEGSVTVLGKAVGTDASQKKATYTTILGLKKAKESLEYFYHEARSALTPFGAKMDTLKRLAEYIVRRDH